MNQNAVVIRPVAEADLAALVALLASIDGERPFTVERLSGQLARVRAFPGYTVYVAMHDGRVVGTFSQLIFPALAHGGASESLVEAVVVSAEVRGLGIGRQMMEFARQRAGEAGCYKLALSSNAKRLDAHRFYLGMGFQQQGISFSIDTEAATASMA